MKPAVKTTLRRGFGRCFLNLGGAFNPARTVGGGDLRAVGQPRWRPQVKANCPRPQTAVAEEATTRDAE